MTGPNFYFNNFLIGDRENKLFAFLPFLDKCTNRFNNVIKPAAEFMDLKSEITNDERSGKEIMERVYEAINTSKILLFDLSKDDRYNNKVNPNIAYELGVARSVREDTDILLITDIEDVEKEIFFDIRGMHIIKIQSDFTKEKFYEILKSVCKEQKYYQDKRIEAISKLIDGEGIALMYKHGRLPDGYKHFSTSGMSAELKMSALRLLDLGLVKAEWGCYKKGYEYAYHWTSFGKAIMKHMGINEIGLEEFKKLPEYQERLKFEENYREFKRKVSE